MQGVDLVLIEVDDARIHLIADVEEHIDQRHAVVGKIADDLGILVVFQRIAGVHHLRQLVIQPRHLGELAGGEAVFQHIAVQRLNVGKAAGVVHLVVAFQLLDHGRFHPVIVVFGDDKGHQVGFCEVLVDHIGSDLGLILHRGLDGAVAIRVGTQGLKVVSKHQHHRKHDGHQHPGLVSKAADEGNFGHKIPVLRFFHVGAKQHQQAGHDHKDRQHGEEDGLDEADAHICADLELHEQHSHQTADGGQRAGADLGDAFGGGLDDGLLQLKTLLFLLEVVAEDDGVVQRKGQLQNVRHRVGDEGDLAQQEVGAHVQDHAHHKGQQQNGHLRKGLGGKEQHRHDDDGDVHHDDVDFPLNGLLLGVAQRGGDVNIVIRQVVLDIFQRFQTLVVVLRVIEGDGVQGRHIIIMGRSIVVLDHLDALEGGQFIVERVGLVRGHIGHHDVRRAVGRKLLVHDVQAHAGLRRLGQIGGQVAFHHHPVAGKQGEDRTDDHDEEHQVAAFHDLQGQFMHKVVLRTFLLVLVHRAAPFPEKGPRMAVSAHRCRDSCFIKNLLIL